MNLIKNEEICLSVDYGPCLMLAECAKEAEVDAIFPLKTVMKIKRNEATVKEGYGNCPQIFYSEEPS